VFRTLPALVLLTAMPALTQDFDFLHGTWKIHNTYLKQRLAGSNEWLEFDATGEVTPILGGLGNIDSFHALRNGKHVEGATLRLFNPTTGEWSIYWADNVRAGILQPPMIGKFKNGVGEFFGDEELNGRKVLCRFHWTHSADSPRWEQAFSADGGKTWETNWIMTFQRTTAPATDDFSVYELRRYKIHHGEVQRFAAYFESYFPEAMQVLGSLTLGQFAERNMPDRFTWIRGFHNMPERGVATQQFYASPLWKEHSRTMNDLLTDSDDVLLLRPLSPVPVLPAVDPLKEKAHGTVVAQIFAVTNADEFAQAATKSFEHYRALPGMREAGILATLDEPNNYPRLPIRTDGPFVVWLGILEGGDVPSEVFEKESKRLATTNLLRAPTELLILDPTPRSRLRWIK